MNEIQVFNNSDFGDIRILTINDEPWFVVADVCKSLEIGNPSQAISRLDADEKMNTLISNEGNKQGNPNMTVVNEPGLYTLILGSRKPEAKAFKRWITHDVIPSIRKHGLYMTPAKLQETLAKPENLFVILQTLAEEQKKNAELTEVNQKIEETNLLLASGEHQWSGKALLNALVRSYAKNCCGGNNGYAWTYYYKQLKYKHGIDVSIRKAKSKDKNIKKIDLIRDNEMNVAVKLAASICEQSGLDVPYIINLVNAGVIYPYEAS